MCCKITSFLCILQTFIYKKCIFVLSIIHIVRGLLRVVYIALQDSIRLSQTYSNHRLEYLSFNLHMSEFNNAHVYISYFIHIYVLLLKLLCCKFRLFFVISQYYFIKMGESHLFFVTLPSKRERLLQAAALL